MQVDKLDVENCEKLLQAILKKATFKVTGEEVLAANQLIMWAVKLKGRMQSSIDATAAKTQAAPAPITHIPEAKKPKK